MGKDITTKSVLSLLKAMPDYADFKQEKNGVIDGVFKFKTLKDIEYELFTYISHKKEFSRFNPFTINYSELVNNL